VEVRGVRFLSRVPVVYSGLTLRSGRTGARDGRTLIDVSEQPPALRSALAVHAAPRLGRSAFDLATSVVAYLVIAAAMFAATDVSYLLVLALSIPAAGFLIRTFIVFHDCAHGSFLRSKRANATLGGALGVILFTPFAWWRHKHAVHHATTGDLDRRGTGDIQTLTIDEYRARPWWGRIGYRLFRNPLVMFGLGPLWVVLVNPRLVTPGMSPRLRRSVLATNAALVVVIGGLCWLFGWQDVLLVLAPPLFLTGAAGIWLFYVQHQFEDAYWEHKDDWSFDEAALQGSSYLRLPRILQFFTGNIGFHHVHHLSARIPNYNLQAAHDNTELGPVPTLSLLDALRAVRLKLWDAEQRRLVTFREAGRKPSQAAVWQPGATVDTR
jgi:omega-6 fatty acid desaturase (delta-12 desaturase)